MDAREYLSSIKPTKEEVENFLTRDTVEGYHPNRGWTYDRELGWVHTDTLHEADGVLGTRTFYQYENDGARKLINFPERQSRLHTYGNSFTHCDQVSDGETWQEYIAAHLQEPIRNYGVGGHGVYQAYRRMLKIHSEAKHDASHVILNIWDDDHFRSLDSWRRLRFGRSTTCGFTLPHVRVNVQKQEVTEHDNYLQSPDDVFKLCDDDYIFNQFKDDPILKMSLATKGQTEIDPDSLDPVAVSFGIAPHLVSNDQAGAAIRDAHTQAALMASKYIVTKAAKFCEQTGKKFMLVLSFGRGNVIEHLTGSKRFDQLFVDWAMQQNFPMIDMLPIWKDAFANRKQSAEDFLAPYYNGHHSPAGNNFFAWAMMDKIVSWLDPTPLPYKHK